MNSSVERDTPTSTAVKVLYIAGTARSGSTILDILLGQFDGFVSTGTLLWIWNDGLLRNDPCGCGRAVRDCEFWARVLERAFGGVTQVEAASLARLQQRLTSSVRPASMWSIMGAREPSAELSQYLGALDCLYRAIRDVGGCRVVVDSSKLPLYAAILGRLPSLEVHVVHLVRDPRATTFSWMRRKQAARGRFLEPRSPLRSAAYWVVRNQMIRSLGRRSDRRPRLVIYERFARSPRATVESIVRAVAGDTRGSPFLDADTVNLRVTHTVGGNPARFGGVTRRIVLDETWKAEMPWSARVAVTAMTWPWIKRYGYR